MENNKNCYYIYAYLDPISRIPFYIGKGKGSRDKSHLNEAIRKKNLKTKSYKLNKIKKILENGDLPIIERWSEGLTEKDAYEYERDIISSFGRKTDGGCLTNISAGQSSPRNTTNREGNRKTEKITLYNVDGRIIEATRYELVHEYNITYSIVSNLFKGKQKTTGEWSVDKTLLDGIAKTYCFFNKKTGEKFLFNRKEFSDYTGISLACISELLSQKKKNIREWIILLNHEDAPPKDEVYHFLNKITGVDEICTIDELCKTYKLQKSRIERLITTSDHNRNLHKGWGLYDVVKDIKRTSVSDERIYFFKNKKTGETFSGTQKQFRTQFNIPLKMCSALVNMKKKSVYGWVISHPPHQLPLHHHEYPDISELEHRCVRVI